MRIKTLAKQFLPPGWSTEKEINTACLSLLMVILCGIISLVTFTYAQMSITSNGFGTRIFKPGVMLLPFDEMMRGRFLPFWIHTALCVVLGFRHYHSFYEDSMSIYVMKRLRDPFELHVRCVTLPLLLFFAGLLLALLLIYLLWLLYNCAIPETWRPTEDTLRIWQLFLP